MESIKKLFFAVQNIAESYSRALAQTQPQLKKPNSAQ